MKKTLWVFALSIVCVAPSVAFADYPVGFGFFEPFPGTIDNTFPTGVWWNQFYIEPSVQTENDPSLNGVFISHDFMSCTDADTGKFISCEFKYVVKGLDNGSDQQIPFNGELSSTDTWGGHELHTSNDPAHPQPFIYAPPIPQLYVRVDGGAVDSNSSDASGVTTVHGYTANGLTEFTFGEPEVAGSTWVEATLIVPENYICLAGCADSKTTITHETVVREIGGLQQLPAPVLGVDVYTILRDTVDAPPQGDPGHADADATWGEPQTITEFEAIARKYHDISPVGANMQINDMSLPHGGLFDTHDDWNLNSSGNFNNAPHSHQDHRYGLAFDLNKRDTANQLIPCQADENKLYTLKGIVREQNFEYSPGNAGTPQQPIAVVCEKPLTGPPSTLPRIHINVNAATPLQLLQILDLPPPQQGLVP